jgi:hypothetical protein
MSNKKDIHLGQPVYVAYRECAQHSVLRTATKIAQNGSFSRKIGILGSCFVQSKAFFRGK